MSCVSKHYSKMLPVSCTNTPHDVADFLNHGIVKIKKLEYLENETYLFCKKKKFLACASDDTFWEVIVL